VLRVFHDAEGNLSHRAERDRWASASMKGTVIDAGARQAAHSLASANCDVLPVDDTVNGKYLIQFHC